MTATNSCTGSAALCPSHSSPTLPRPLSLTLSLTYVGTSPPNRVRIVEKHVFLYTVRSVRGEGRVSRRCRGGLDYERAAVRQVGWLASRMVCITSGKNLVAWGSSTSFRWACRRAGGLEHANAVKAQHSSWACSPVPLSAPRPRRCGTAAPVPGQPRSLGNRREARVRLAPDSSPASS